MQPMSSSAGYYVSISEKGGTANYILGLESSHEDYINFDARSDQIVDIEFKQSNTEDKDLTMKFRKVKYCDDSGNKYNIIVLASEAVAEQENNE